MQSVPTPAWRLRPTRALWVVAALAIVGLGVLVSANQDAAQPATAKSDLQLIGGKPLQQASCQEWRTATPDERAAVLGTLKRDVGGSTPYGRGTTLTDPDAFALFDRACARPYADGFLLYQIYTRAAAFQHAPERFQ